MFNIKENKVVSVEIFNFRMAEDMKIMTNKPNISQWTLEKGYTKDTNGNEYPYRIYNAKHFGAMVTYPQLFEEDLEGLCKETSEGYIVYLR